MWLQAWRPAQVSAAEPPRKKSQTNRITNFIIRKHLESNVRNFEENVVFSWVRIKANAKHVKTPHLTRRRKEKTYGFFIILKSKQTTNAFMHAMSKV